MNKGLETQIRGAFEALDDAQVAVTVEDVMHAVGPVQPLPFGESETLRPLPGPMPLASRARLPGWSYAAAAAVVVLVLIGGALLPLRPDSTQPADTPSTTTVEVTPTTVEVTPTTEAPITTDTTAVTTTTLAAAPVVPPGEGPRLEFVQVESPDDQPFVEGVWFDGAFYALSHDRLGEAETELFRSTDGLSWDLVPGFPGGKGGIESWLQTDADRLVSVVVPRDPQNSCNGSFIEVNTSTNGADWVSSEIEMPVPRGSYRECANKGSVTAFAVGAKGMVVAANISLSFEGEEFANSLVDPDAGIHVELVGFDLDRGVMIVQFLDENNDMEPIGDLLEVDLNESGFSRDFANLLDFMSNDPTWEPLLDGFIAEARRGFASVSVGAAWFSTGGVTWRRIDGPAPFDGGAFSAIVATPDGFVATASVASAGDLEWAWTRSVWESANGTVWTEATDLITGQGAAGGWYTSSLDTWNGELVEYSVVGEGAPEDHVNRQVWTLADPSRRLFSDIPMHGMNLVISEHGLIGTTDDTDFLPPGTIEVLLSVDGTSWSRWEPSEFGPGPARAWIVGVGDDFVVIQVTVDVPQGVPSSHSLWVGRLP